MTGNIHSTAIIEDGARIADDAVIGAYCVIGAQVEIGSGTVLHNNVTIAGHVSIGAGNEIFPYAVIGTPPQHLRYKGEETKVAIGDSNIIREHMTIHRGTVFGNGTTVIGNGNFLMTTCHIGHDCILGDNIIMASGTVLGGHSVIGNHAYIGGGCAVRQFVRIGHYAMLAGLSGAAADIIPFGYAQGLVANLKGLNVIGLKRQGFAAESIKSLREAHSLIFESSGGVFTARLDEAEKTYGKDEHVAAMIQFIRDGGDQPLCHPGHGRGESENDRQE